jgi:hypothetical protein
MLSREEVEAQLRDGGYLAIFAREVRGALQDWYKVIGANPAEMGGANSRERAVYLNRRIIERICNALEGRPGVVITKQHQAILITINNQITLRFKKLNRERRTMSTPTRRVRLLWYENIPLPGEFEEWINVTCGWLLSNAGTLLEVAVINEYNNELNWLIVASDEAEAQPMPVQLPLAPVQPSDEPQVYIAKVRDTERARRMAKDKADDAKREG